MPERTYKMIELVGVSEKSFADAANNAVKKASETLRGLAWFEVVEQRGMVKDGEVGEFQVKIRLAFKLEAESAAGSGAGRRGRR